MYNQKFIKQLREKIEAQRRAIKRLDKNFKGIAWDLRLLQPNAPDKWGLTLEFTCQDLSEMLDDAEKILERVSK